MKKAIAMRCTKKQYKSVKPKLKSFTKSIKHGFKMFPYLTNRFNYSENFIGNIDLGMAKTDPEKEIHETWNEKVFLEACGIETEPEYVITERQIKKLYELTGFESKTNNKLREWFPDAFKEGKNDLHKVGNWYCYDKYGKSTYYVTKIKGYEVYGYGIDYKGEWSNECFWCNTKDNDNNYLRKATPEEVTEALIKEAIKRGFIDGAWINNNGINDFMSKKSKICGAFDWIPSSNILEDTNGNGHIFDNGKWAEIIETITKEEAEKELGKKIV